jgi:hypothetical protein
MLSNYRKPKSNQYQYLNYINESNINQLGVIINQPISNHIHNLRHSDETNNYKYRMYHKSRQEWTHWTQNNGEIENLETGDECIGDTRTEKR